MGNPRFTYNGKTIDLSEQKFFDLAVLASPPRTANLTLTGDFEVLTVPRIDVAVSLRSKPITSLTLRYSLENLWQWQQQGEEWTFAMDSDKTVDTLVSVDAAAGATTVYVDEPTGITAGQTYKIIDGPNYQLVTIDSVSGDLVTLTATLDNDFTAGAIFRDQFYFPAVLRDPGAPSPIFIHPADDLQAWPPSRFSYNLDFHEDTRQETSMIFKALSGNASGSDVNTAQPWFPSAGGASLAANTTYFFDGELRISRAAGTNSHTTSLLFGGTATLTGIKYKAICNTGDTVANIAENGISGEVATAIVAKAASTSATEQISIRVTGVVRINAAGTFIPQFQYSAAPGGAPSILANSYFRLWPEGSGSVVSRGTWS